VNYVCVQIDEDVPEEHVECHVNVARQLSLFVFDRVTLSPLGERQHERAFEFTLCPIVEKRENSEVLSHQDILASFRGSFIFYKLQFNFFFFFKNGKLLSLSLISLSLKAQLSH